MAEPQPQAEPAPEPAGRRPSAAGRSSRGRIAALLLAGLLLFGIGLYVGPRAVRLAGIDQPPPPTVVPHDPLAEQRLAALEARIAQLDSNAPAATPAANGPAASGPDPAARLETLEAAVERLAQTDSGLSARLDQLSGQVAAIADGTLRANDQARDLLLIAVVRRFLDLGRPLGPLLPQMEARFAARDSGAVAALAAWSRAPQSARLLAQRLVQLRTGPVEPQAAPGEGWWHRLWAQTSRLVLVRPASAVQERPAELAREALAAGDVPLAVSLLQAAPRTPALDRWLADAGRLAAATSAVDRLEGRVFDAAAAPAAPEPPVNAAPGGGPLS